MKFNIAKIAPKELYTLEEEVNFKSVRKPLLALNHLKVRADIFNDGNLINVTLAIRGTAVVACAYTLEPVDYPLNFTESIDLSDDPNNPDTYYVEGSVVDLDPIILDLVVGEIPTRVVKKGAKIKASGEGYRVLSEDELRKQKDNEYNPAFDKLKDFDV
ncbi:MAG: DUF177 domain-containing protein [Bacilli bacterium]|nr:DUF177 domain-containing protein [Bacilli bacterium]